MRRGSISFPLAIGLLAASQAWGAAHLNVVATTEHSAAIAKIVGGNRIAVAYLATGAQDPHAIEPKRSFSVLLNRANLLIVNGQGLEAAWLPTALAESTNSRIMEGKLGYLDASTGAHLIAYDQEELERPFLFNIILSLNPFLGRGVPQAELGNNHHYWLDPANGETIARAIFERLALLDAPAAEFYQVNYERFVSKLQEKATEWDAIMKPFAGAEIVSYHRDWTYLARRHGIKVFDYVEPKEPFILGPTRISSPPDQADLSTLIARIRRSRVKLILANTYQDRAAAGQIARGTGARVLILPSSVSRSEGIEDYFQLFDRVYQELSKALQRSDG